MLPASARLKKDADFSRVLQAGRKELSGPLLIFTAPSEAEAARFGVVVSKKVSKKAVDRNLIRRQLADLLRSLAENSPAADTVILVLRPEPFAVYQQALEKWQKKR